MDYKRIYDEFIANRRAKEHLLTSGFEWHHIEPRCRGGDNSPGNFIKLSYADHLFSHLLLARIYGGLELWLAVNLMLHDGKQRGRPARAWYSSMKSEVSKAKRLAWEETPLEEREAIMRRVYSAGQAALSAMTEDERAEWENGISQKVIAHWARLTPEERLAHMQPALAVGTHAARIVNMEMFSRMTAEEMEVRMAPARAGNRAYFQAMTPEERRAVMKPAWDARKAAHERKRLAAKNTA